MRVSLFCAAVIGLFGSGASWSNVRLPSLIGDDMVLQRDARIRVWGWADPGESVQIAFHGLKALTRADKKGRWRVSVGPFGAGGPYEMTVKGKNNLSLHNILLGDVWLASGQSNMEFPVKQDGDFGGVNNADQEIAEAEFSRIRLFKVHHKVALEPKEDVEADRWTPVTPETVGNFSAVAYLFGRELHQRYKVPIGLIESAWAGTVAEAWVSETSLKPFPEFQQSVASLKGIDEKAALAEDDRYVKEKAAWYGRHAADDRGRIDGRNMWADADFDAGAWPTIDEPRAKAIEALEGFDGLVWFRKDFQVPNEQQGQSLCVHLQAWKSVEAYFNGERVGDTQGGDASRDYLVPGRLVKAGRNVLTLRIIGSGGFVGMYDEPDKMNVEAGGAVIPLAGKWFYQSGPDLAALPKPSAFSKIQSDPNTATLLFNGMIAPLTPYRIKGVIWYQGESNVNRAAQYRALFPALIQDWRRERAYDVPFLFVQLAGFEANKAEPAEYQRADLREAQGMALSLPNTGMATAVDIGDEEDIHPRDKQDVAHRLALSAARVAYGEDVLNSGPVYQSMQIEGNQIRIRFSSLGTGLLIKDKYGYGRGFETAAADGKFAWAQARQDGGDIVVFNESIQQPVAVRYDWSNTPDGNLFNKEGLPAVPFRTVPGLNPTSGKGGDQ